MSFHITNKLGSKKVYWCLSEHAIKTILSDMRDYNIQNINSVFNTPSKILNGIFKQYYKYALSSVNRHVNNSILLQDIPANQKEKMNKLLYSIVESRFLGMASTRQNYKFSRETIEIIQNECQDEADIYSGSAANYFRAVLEEYALLPKYEREKYLYIDRYNRIISCIDSSNESKKILEVVTTSSKSSTSDIVYAYRMQPDKNLNHYYFVGICKKNIEHEYALYCVRLTNISYLNIAPVNSDIFDAQQLNELKIQIDKELEHTDIPYLRNNYYDSIKVRFTDKGLQILQRVIHNRPEYAFSKDDNHLCIFSCTDREIYNYLHNFGGEAVILEPVIIKERMRIFYDRAHEAYL